MCDNYGFPLVLIFEELIDIDKQAEQKQEEEIKEDKEVERLKK